MKRIITLAVALLVGVGLMSPTAAHADSAYDAAAASSMRNLGQAMNMLGLMNGNYTRVSEAELRNWGWTRGAFESVEVWAEGNGRTWRGVLRDIRGSAEYSFTTSGDFNGVPRNSAAQTSPQPLFPRIIPGFRFNALNNSIDEAALATALVAGAVATTEVRAASAIIPGPRTGLTSLPDHTVACFAAAGRTGATMTTTLRTMQATGMAGRAAVASVARHFAPAAGILATTPAWVNVNAPETQRPTPPAVVSQLDSYFRVPQVAADIATKNQIPSNFANAITKECIDLVSQMWHTLADPYEECKSKPIFVSGRDVEAAADHDIYAIQLGLTQGVNWMALNWDGKPHTSWYRGDERCAEAAASNGAKHCDEYPFGSVQQGGGNAVPQPSLRSITRADNTRQGGLLVSFYNTCGIRERPNRDFLHVPIPAAAGDIPSQTRVCNF